MTINRRQNAREELLGRIRRQRRGLESRLSRLQQLEANIAPVLRLGVSKMGRTLPLALGGLGIAWVFKQWIKRSKQ